eukprot:scaffold122904_cov30-Tisochrysis_lutea.AAC.3
METVLAFEKVCAPLALTCMFAYRQFKSPSEYVLVLLCDSTAMIAEPMVITTAPPTVHSPGTSSTPMITPSSVETKGPRSIAAETINAGTYFITATYAR